MRDITVYEDRMAPFVTELLCKIIDSGRDFMSLTAEDFSNSITEELVDSANGSPRRDAVLATSELLLDFTASVLGRKIVDLGLIEDINIKKDVLMKWRVKLADAIEAELMSKKPTTELIAKFDIPTEAVEIVHSSIGYFIWRFIDETCKLDSYTDRFMKKSGTPDTRLFISNLKEIQRAQNEYHRPSQKAVTEILNKVIESGRNPSQITLADFPESLVKSFRKDNGDYDNSVIISIAFPLLMFSSEWIGERMVEAGISDRVGVDSPETLSEWAQNLVNAFQIELDGEEEIANFMKQVKLEPELAAEVKSPIGYTILYFTEEIMYKRKPFVQKHLKKIHGNPDAVGAWLAMLRENIEKSQAGESSRD